jgi:uncharacterized protein (TIGR03067 family)
MFRASVILVLVAVLTTAAHCSDEKGEAGLQGTWQAATAELAGQKMPDGFANSVQLTIENEKYAVKVGEGEDKGTLKFDTSGKLKAMDIIGTEGPNKGKTFLAIYELNGDSLTICYDLDGKTRPTEFKTKEQTTLFLVNYKRKKS